MQALTATAISRSSSYGAALRCWWPTPDRWRAITSSPQPSGLDVDQSDPRLLVIPRVRGSDRAGRGGHRSPVPARTRRGRRRSGHTTRWQRGDGGRGVRCSCSVSRSLGRRAARPGVGSASSGERSRCKRGAPRISPTWAGDPCCRGRTSASAGDEPAAGHGNGSGRPGAAGRAPRRPASRSGACRPGRAGGSQLSAARSQLALGNT